MRVAGVQRTAKSMVINLHKVHDDRKSAPRPYASGRKYADRENRSCEAVPSRLDDSSPVFWKTDFTSYPSNGIAERQPRPTATLTALYSPSTTLLHATIPDQRYEWSVPWLLFKVEESKYLFGKKKYGNLNGIPIMISLVR